MNAEELTLNIAVNLGRISRWATEGKETRIKQFLLDTENYLNELRRAQKSKQFEKTFVIFEKRFAHLKNNIALTDEWAEETLTWANILTHRAKLA